MRKIFILFGFILSALNGWTDTKTEQASNFVNEAFLVLVDTFAYKYNTLRPAPNSPITNNKDSFKITIYNKLIPLDEYEAFIT